MFIIYYCAINIRSTISFFEKIFKIKIDRSSKFKVGFIICGTQKGGTTALDHYLRQHREICMANKKELHFFDNDENFMDTNPDYVRYHNYFSLKESHSIIGEATPIYMYWNQSIERIHSYNPNMRLIVILRNPIERAFSHWNMERHRQRESRTFWDAIKEEKKEIQSSVHKQHRTFSYLERGLYFKQIKNIYNYFKEDQLLIIRNEELRNDLNKVLQDISNFLSIKLFDKVETKNIHSRPYTSKLNEREGQLLTSFYNKDIKSLEALLEWDLSGWGI